MLKKKWTKPTIMIHPIDMEKIGDESKLSDSELKIRLEESGYKFTQNRIYYSKPNYILREIVGESVLVSVGNGIVDFCGIVKLNASAKVIWNALQNGATKGELIQGLIDVFSIPEEQAREDVENSLELLMQREMVICE